MNTKHFDGVTLTKSKENTKNTKTHVNPAFMYFTSFTLSTGQLQGFH